MVVLTVGGPPGSGTSTLCRLLKETTGLRYVYAGQIFRDMAQDKGFTLMEFSALCQKDPSIDMGLDRSMLEEARKGDVILEGRMIGPLCSRDNIDSFRIYVDADASERARRVMERDGGDLRDVIRTMKEREDIELDRYIRYYGIDPNEGSWYDMVIDSTHLTPKEVLGKVMDAANDGRC